MCFLYKNYLFGDISYLNDITVFNLVEQPKVEPKKQKTVDSRLSSKEPIPKRPFKPKRAWLTESAQDGFPIYQKLDIFFKRLC